MSSPSSVGGNNNASVGIREGTRVILREITANLQNSSPGTSPRRKTGNEGTSTKGDLNQQHNHVGQNQHDVKVRFIREFAEATSTTTVTNPRVSSDRPPENGSLSSASSFQSLASTLSSKCSSGICVDSSPTKNADRSYLNLEISGLDDIISACENIQLEDQRTIERSFDLRIDSEESSNLDETFASAADRSTIEIIGSKSNSNLNVTSPIDSSNFNATLNLDTDSTDFNLNVTDQNESTVFQDPDEIDATSDLLKPIDREIDTDLLTDHRQNLDSELNVTREISKSPIDRKSYDREIDTDLLTDHRQNLDSDLNVTREISKSPIDRKNTDRKSIDRTVDTDLQFDNHGNNLYHETVESELNVTREFTKSPIDRRDTDLIPENRINDLSPKSVDSDLNVTRESPESSISRKDTDLLAENREDTDLLNKNRKTGQFLETVDSDLNVTRELTESSIDRKDTDLLSENKRDTDLLNENRKTDQFLETVDSDLNVTTELTESSIERKDTDLLPETRTDTDLLSKTHKSDNFLKTVDTDLNVTKEFPKSPIDRRNTDFPETGSISEGEYNGIERGSNVDRIIEVDDLEATRVISDEDNSTIRSGTDLDTTREVTRESIDSTGEGSTLREVCREENDRKVDSEKSVESQYVRDDEGFAGYEEYPLESITPSISQFHENLHSPLIRRETGEENSTSGEIETSTDLLNFSRTSEIKETSKLPVLPSFSSIRSISEVSQSAIEENINEALPVTSPTSKSEENTLEIVDSKSDEFVATYGAERTSGNSGIEDQCYVCPPSLLDTSVGINDPKSNVLVASPSPSPKTIENEVSKDSSQKTHSGSLLTPVERNEEIIQTKKGNERNNKLSPIPGSPNSCGLSETEIDKESFPGDKRENSNEDLDSTVIADDADEPISKPEDYTEFVPLKQSTAISQPKLETQISCIVASAGDDRTFISRPISLTDDYSAFQPQKQSTTLDVFTSPLSSKLQRQRTPFVTALATTQETSLNPAANGKTTPIKRREIVVDRSNFAQLEIAANSVANDIFNSSLDFAEDNEHYVSAESELFHDPSNFDFLLSKTPRKNTKSNLREVSLYVKFDPLVSNTSMLPQGNIQNASPPVTNNEATRNGENNATIPSIGTPKQNPAIAAIDRLLFYSPMPTNTTPADTNTNIQKTNDTQEKLKAAEETSEETINMAKELELVRTTVLQLEEQLEKLKIEREDALEQLASCKEKNNQLQAQLAQEIKHKNEITVVVDEYEISISRLVAERERDRKNLDLEKAKLHEELAAAKHHLDNTEAAFNDVHLKYERLKAVVATYKNNEIAFKESLRENVEIIKALENRYEQVKSHATARLEKANQDLEEIRKQNESETVKLRAMLRKAELKSNSLAELVEQKTKENKELTQILDEVIARVGCNKAE